MRKRILAALLAAMMVLAFSGCGKAEIPEPAPEREPVVQPEFEPEPEPEVYVPSGTNPLTGLPMEPEFENDRPVAVMFNNIKAAQPQLGISQADLIYEVVAEGGITRMLALYQSLEGVGNLGSIRSTRTYYLELALGHDALLVHAGGSPDAYQKIPAWDVDNMDGVNGGSDAKIFWRDAERRKAMGYEHSLLTSGEAILEYLAQDHFRLQHEEGDSSPQLFSENGTPAAGTAAEHISVKFSNYKTGTFDYDAASGLYLAGQYGSDHIDGETGEQVSVTNVLVLETSISVISGDTAGRLSVRLTGAGDGTFFCGGKSIPIQWSKADRNSPFVYTLEDGTPLALGQGKTYVCIISSSSGSVSIS